MNENDVNCGCGKSRNPDNQKLIEKREYLEIEDKGATAAETMAATKASCDVPKKKKGIFGWLVAGLLALLAIGCCIYFATRDHRANDNLRAHTTVVKKVIKKKIIRKGTADNQLASNTIPSKERIVAEANRGQLVDYLYYFGNDKDGIPENETLNTIAEQAKQKDADITITAYASEKGTPGYNSALCERRADNIEAYLEAHGVNPDQITVVNGGETSKFGGEAYNRRADILVNYAG